MLGSSILVPSRSIFRLAGRRRLSPLPSHQPESWGHFAQFYENDDFLAETVACLAGETLRTGSSVVIVATSAHRLGIEQHLQSHGLGLDILRSEGRYTALDAAATLAAFSTNWEPDENRFNEVVGSLIRSAASSSKNGVVFAFGEMVALLCGEDKAAAALKLEQFWNRLGASYRFSLCCGYPMSVFAIATAFDLVFDICAEHSLAVPAETLP